MRTLIYPQAILVSITISFSLNLYYLFHGMIRARSDEHFFFGNDQLSQKLWQSICVHTQQRKVLKKLCQRIFVNVFFLYNLCCCVHANDTNSAKHICLCKLACVSMQRVFVASYIFHKCDLSHFPRRYMYSLKISVYMSFN